MTDAESTAVPGDPQIISGGGEDGLVKCPSCGATEIALNIASGKLRCAYCRHEWLPESGDDAFDLNGDIGLLDGLVIGAGSQDIQASVDLVRTFKCSACGAEVVIDTASSLQARCHWCRNTLSVNDQIENGAVPDVVLPFSLTKEQAVAKIDEFVGARKFFAHPRFKAEFNAENVIGVYLPYMIIDVNAHAKMSGEAEHQTREYTVRVGDDTETRYDADVYRVAREFDLHINDLTIESSEERAQRGFHNSNNVINAIMPFDTENSLRWDANFLSGFSSERRDTDIGDLTPKVTAESKDIARFSANDTLEFYDRGVRWDSEELTVKGQRWVAAYLPVWLYSYFQDKGDGHGMLHYVAVNGRTGSTMGSVPLHQPKLLAVSTIVEVIAVILAVLILAAVA
ncbi:MAG: TFIIB-type zinc ribbon-containing protein [Actinobacteria bacterium]|nr:TFIIB-type zinc ribbon-containing protein [Actinomycetota bacterium]